MSVIPSGLKAVRTLNLSIVPLAEAKKPAFAVAGLADLWIEQVKDAPAAYVAEVRRAQERLAEVPSVVKALPAQARALPAQARALPAQARALPAQAKALRGEVETRVAKATDEASEFYAALAIRGERLVTQIRRQPATEAALAEGKEAVRKAEAAAVAARNSVRAGEKAVTDAAAKLG